MAQEAEAITLLRDGTDLPVPTWAIHDADCDVLQHPYVLVDWLDGTSSLEIFEKADPEDRMWLA